MDKDNDDLETIRKTLPEFGMTGTYIGDEPEPEPEPKDGILKLAKTEFGFSWFG